MRTTIRIRVSGRVQGVSYRATLREFSLRNGVSGWVRNLEDGSVEALLQGEEPDVTAVVEWARRGPPLAEVTHLHLERASPNLVLIGFVVREE